MELQRKLLQVSQKQEYERLGSARTQRVDVRLVAATNRDLAQMVNVGQLGANLYYRLNVFPIMMPPLRQRSEDISLLVRHFVRHYVQTHNVAVSYGEARHLSPAVVTTRFVPLRHQGAPSL